MRFRGDSIPSLWLTLANFVCKVERALCLARVSPARAIALWPCIVVAGEHGVHGAHAAEYGRIIGMNYSTGGFIANTAHI